MKIFILLLSNSTFIELSLTLTIHRNRQNLTFFILNSKSQSESEYIAQQNPQQKDNSAQAQEWTGRR